MVELEHIGKIQFIWAITAICITVVSSIIGVAPYQSTKEVGGHLFVQFYILLLSNYLVHTLGQEH